MSKDSIDVLIKPMTELKQQNHYLSSELEDMTSTLQIVEQQEQEAREQTEETRKALESEQEQAS